MLRVTLVIKERVNKLVFQLLPWTSSNRGPREGRTVYLVTWASAHPSASAVLRTAAYE